MLHYAHGKPTEEARVTPARAFILDMREAEQP